MNDFSISLIGIVAGFCTTISFVPQLIKILKTKHVRDISLYMYVLLAVGILLWIVYGVLLKALPIILANSIALIVNLVILAMKIKYDRK